MTRRAVRDIELNGRAHEEGHEGFFRLAFIRHDPFVLDTHSTVPYVTQRALYDQDINRRVQRAVDTYRFGVRALEAGNRIECNFIPQAVLVHLQHLQDEQRHDRVLQRPFGAAPGRRQRARWAIAC